LYEKLEEETGLSTGFKRCGSLTVARTPDRLISLERIAARNEAFGVPSLIVSPDECGKYMNGLINTHDLTGGMWLPKDGSGSPTDLTMSFLAGARMGGAKLHEGVRVASFDAKV
jgi:glycine/D-amino acid oxidase-like deaminating enzyme